jgi:predicted N-acetyltransferase YhbS
VSLVAVSGSAPFWHALGFRRVDTPELAVPLASYDSEACMMVHALTP